jgi:hypothetical protein
MSAAVPEIGACSKDDKRCGYQPWRPTRAVRVVLDQVLGIFEEYAAQRPLTIRQVFYRLVGAHSYEKTEQAYGRLLYYLDRPVGLA